MVDKTTAVIDDYRIRFLPRVFPAKCKKNILNNILKREKFLSRKIEAKKIRFCLLKNIFDREVTGGSDHI